MLTAATSKIAFPGDAAEIYPDVACHPFPFLLESLAIDRHTYLGSDPYAVLTARSGHISLWREGREMTFTGNPFDAIEDLLAERHVEDFPCGAVGAFGYDLGRHLETLPDRAEDDLDLPDLVVGFYDRIVRLDRKTQRGETLQISNPAPMRAISAGTYEEAFGGTSTARGRGRTYTREGYLAAVTRIKEYIAAGDVYQVNLSQRFHATVSRPPFEIYRALREASPARYAAFLQFGRRSVLSSSPEQFLEVRGRTARTRPIKGTRPRGTGAERDERLRQELLASPKDDAELAMIVDLERNDLGRVCEPGSVHVTDPKVLETHPAVHHLSATIEGRIRTGLGPVDLLRASFPGGSITGAPKIRAMEIIDELEPTRRGFYTGAIGHLGFDGSMNLSIAIRTLQSDGPEYYLQAGGGIVADSDPAAEYEETLVKVGALARVLEVPLS